MLIPPQPANSPRMGTDEDKPEMERQEPSLSTAKNTRAIAVNSATLSIFPSPVARSTNS